MDDGSSSNNNDGIINIAIIIVIILILISGGFLLFRKNDKNHLSENTDRNNVVNTEKIEFKKKIDGKIGCLYQDKENKVYFIPNEDNRSVKILNLMQEYNVIKNDIYSSDLIKAILIILPNVSDISYDNEKNEFSLKTVEEKIYFIDENDIKANERVYFYDKKVENDNQDNNDNNNQNTTDDINNNSTKNAKDKIKSFIEEVRGKSADTAQD